MVTVSECRRLSLQIVGNSDSQPKLGSIWAEDTIYIFVSTLRYATYFICNIYLLKDYSIQRRFIYLLQILIYFTLLKK